MTTRAVIVTGAGSGLGRAIAERLGTDRYRVFVSDIDGDAAMETVSGISDAGGSARALSLDVSDPAQVSSAVASVLEEGSLYGLVNNAGVGRASPFLDLSLDDWTRTMGVNVTGAFMMSQACLPSMVAAGEGAIVNMSSIAGKDAWPNWVHYAASKHAIIGLTRGLAREFGPSNVRVTAVCPGAIKTAIWSPEAQGTDDPDAFYDSLVESTSLKRGQSAEDVAAAVAFLLGPESRNITGVSLSVDSGLLFS